MNETLHTKETPPQLQAYERDDLVILTGTANPNLARSVSNILGLEYNPSVSTFSDGETNVQLPTNVRQKNVVILQSSAGSYQATADTHIMEIGLMANAARLSKAAHISAVSPCLAYSRQDRKSNPRVPISSAYMMQILELNIDYLLTMDLHAPQIQGFFRGNGLDDLPGRYAFKPYIEQWNLENPMFVSPDAGGIGRIQKSVLPHFDFEAGLAAISKTRKGDGSDASKTLGVMTVQEGNGTRKIEGSDCIIWDDLIASGGSMVQAADVLHKHGAASIRAVATHGVFNDRAIQRLADSRIEQVLVSNSINQPPVMKLLEKTGKFKVVDIAPMLAKAIMMNQSGESLSTEFYNGTYY